MSSNPSPVDPKPQSQNEPKKHDVHHLKNEAEYNEMIKDPNVKLVIKASAFWCGPCRKIQPKFESLAREYPQLKFIHVDVEQNDLGDFAFKHGIQSLPTFMFVEEGKVKSKMIGASEKQLEKWLLKCLA
jgi:thioredoxin 1